VTGAAAAPPSFSTPLEINAADDLSDAAEPSIEVDSHGQVYVSGPASLPFGGCPFWEVDLDLRTSAYRGTIDTDHEGVGGGDCDISLSDNPSGTHDQVSVTSLWLGNLTSNTTSDGGATWAPVANPVSQQVFGVDRQWQASDRALDRHYLTVHDLATTNIQSAVSIDGGYQYVQNTPAIDPTTTAQALTSPVGIRGTVGGGNSFGPTVIDPSTHKLYVPFVAPAGNTSELNGIYLAEGDPCTPGPCTPGLPAGPITWTDHLAYAGPLTAGLGDNFPAVAIDGAGVVHLAWTGDAGKPATAGSGQDANRVFTIHSAPRQVAAGSWSTPQAVDPGTGNANVFPWLVAGSAGRVGLAWYSSTLAPACVGPAPVDPSTDVNDDCRNVWSVSYASSANANDAAPSWDVSTVSPGPIHNGAVCTGGLSCDDPTGTPTGTRVLLDFFDVAVDALGRPTIVYNSDVRVPGTADIRVTRQCTGTSLTGVELVGGCGGGTDPTPSPTTGGTACPGGGAGFLDKPGDATEVLVPGETPLPNDPALDLLDGDVSWAAATSTAVFRARLADLGAPPLAGDTYLRWQVRFAGDTTTYNVSATVPADGSPATYAIDDGGLGFAATSGSVDRATGVIEIRVPSSAYQAVQAGNTALTADRRLDLTDVLAQRNAAIATPTADTADTLCDGALAQPTVSSPSPTPSETTTPSPTPTATASASPTPTPTPSETPSPTTSCSPKPNGKEKCPRK
jgi:hypothetical protein